ncbi:response regulator [Caballeronia sp. LZ016]|uniref:response regulator n=1 Tax=Caballeronia sp. LZ016 TaxID=3038554 RepID=UPI002862077B|nr:response regulator [Caballeronia sp. LZ016]MDR5740092.1 response regulator [Caballeronia sp. LZ016]
MSRVLLIDDDRAGRTALEAVLTNCGHTVAVADNGLDGLCAAINEPPDAVVSDVNMPLVDGRDVAWILKTLPESTNVPVVLVSGEVPSTSAPVAAMLQKPVDAALLITLLHAAMDGRAADENYSAMVRWCISVPDLPPRPSASPP